MRFSLCFHTRPAIQKHHWGFLLLAIAIQTLTGCSQTQHRLNADREAYCTIAERNNDPRWAASDVRIDMDPRSRYFDPTNPDCSPMPKDDPASNRYMRCVDGKKGWEHWGDNGVRSELENPQWRVRLAEYTELTDKNEVRLGVDSAVRLAYVNSPLHQNNLETLYLTSLDVTGQRFLLDTQFFGGNSLDYAHQGDVVPASIGFNPVTNQYMVNGPFRTPETNRLTNTNDIQAMRRFATAGEVLVGFANSFAFEFTGRDVSLASSLANFSFIQPLLRGAGRDVALEQLTLTERRLLANLRAYSQFRQGFFTQVLIGELGVTGPQRGGGGTTLQSFSGFGGVNGYLGLLQQVQQIRNTEDNLRLQLRTRDRLEALYDNELIDIVQVDQFRQNIEVTRANLLDQTNSLELSVDNYKTQILGLPSDLPVDLDEELVQQFQLLPTKSASLLESLLQLQERIGEVGELSDLVARVKFVEAQVEDLQDEDLDQDIVDADRALRRLQSLVEAAGRQIKDLPSGLSNWKENSDDYEDELSSSDRESLDIIASLSPAETKELEQQFAEASERLEELMDDLTEDNLDELLEKDSQWLADMLTLCKSVVLARTTAQDLSSEPAGILEEAQQFVEPVRELFEDARSDLKRLEEIAPEREQTMSEEEKERFKRDRERLEQRITDLESGETGLDVAIERLDDLSGLSYKKNRIETIRGLTAWIQSYLQLVERLSLIPAQARLEIITVQEVDLEPEAAFQIALNNRLDFMNGRAALVDSWRAIQVAADALQSDLTITGSGDIRTARNNPLDFRAGTGRLQLGIEFDAPLARLLERNGYRESLIQYQRDRRNLIQSRDALQLGLRALLRTLRQRRLQLEIQRRAVTIALRRVDQTQLSLLTPPPQGQPGQRAQINPTTAINLLSAQSSLQSSQNSFLAAWLDYYAARLRLYRELGVMQLDPNGRWIENSTDIGVASTRTPEAERMDLLPPADSEEVFPPTDSEEEVPDAPNHPIELNRSTKSTRRSRSSRPSVVVESVKANWKPDSIAKPVVQMAEKMDAIERN